MEIHTPVPVEKIELIVNGQVISTKNTIKKAGSYVFDGKISLPEAGWITARVYGGTTSWPVMDSYPYAETSPIWIGEKGSYDSAVAAETARMLGETLEILERKLRAGYGAESIPENNLAQFENARAKLINYQK